jgi:hypothetical protein
MHQRHIETWDAPSRVAIWRVRFVSSIILTREEQLLADGASLPGNQNCVLGASLAPALAPSRNLRAKGRSMNSVWLIIKLPT